MVIRRIEKVTVIIYISKSTTAVVAETCTISVFNIVMKVKRNIYVRWNRYYRNKTH